jgi:hypothetical protein
MINVLLGALCALTLTVAPPTVAGTWTMHVEGGPHGDATMGLTLTQDGAKVSGTFASGHTADMAVAGEFVNGELKIQTTAGGDDSKILFSAKLKEDGTLAGYISSQMGDMKWTATRASGKDGK